MRVEEVMKPPKCCNENDTVQDCAELMRNQNIGFVPICDRAGRPVGAITDRDLAIRIIADGRSPIVLAIDVMTRDVVSCQYGSDIAEAEWLMRQQQKSRVMVCDQDGKLVGVISLSDLAELESAEEAGRTLRRVVSRETEQPHAP